MICKNCRKEFDIVDRNNWGWTRGEKYFCTYQCLRKYEKRLFEHKAKKKALHDIKFPPIK